MKNVPTVIIQDIEDFETLIDTYKPSVVLRTSSDFVIIADRTYFALPRKGFATLQKYWEAKGTLASLSQKEITEAAAGTGVYWTEHGKVFHMYEDCQSLDRSETLITGSAQEAIDAGKSSICDFCWKKHKKELSEVNAPAVSVEE